MNRQYPSLQQVRPKSCVWWKTWVPPWLGTMVREIHQNEIRVSTKRAAQTTTEPGTTEPLLPKYLQGCGGSRGCQDETNRVSGRLLGPDVRPLGMCLRWYLATTPTLGVLFDESKHLGRHLSLHLLPRQQLKALPTWPTWVGLMVSTAVAHTCRQQLNTLHSTRACTHTELLH